LPLHEYPLERAAEAFRFMAAARHVGKIVLHAPAEGPPVALRPDATYLITGGLGALGVRGARPPGAPGARHLAPVRRRAPARAAEEALRGLEREGAQVEVARLDVADPAALARLLDEIDPERPLRGVVHAAGALDDAVLAQQDWPRLERALAPKMAGAWNL